MKSPAIHLIGFVVLIVIFEEILRWFL